MLKTKFCVKYCLDIVCKIKFFCYKKVSIEFSLILRSWFKISRPILAGLFLCIKINRRFILNQSLTGGLFKPNLNQRFKNKPAHSAAKAQKCGKNTKIESLQLVDPRSI